MMNRKTYGKMGMMFTTWSIPMKNWKMRSGENIIQETGAGINRIAAWPIQQDRLWLPVPEIQGIKQGTQSTKAGDDELLFW